MHRICNGWQNPAGPPDENANGALEAVAIIQDGKLSPHLWATATNCQASVGPDGSVIGSALSVNASLDGTLIFYLLGPLPTLDLGCQPAGRGSRDGRRGRPNRARPRSTSS